MNLPIKVNPTDVNAKPKLNGQNNAVLPQIKDFIGPITNISKITQILTNFKYSQENYSKEMGDCQYPARVGQKIQKTDID